MKSQFLVGTYTDPELFGMGQGYGGKAEGLYICDFEEGRITVKDLVKTVNPSFAAICEEKHRVYAVNELPEFQGEEGGGLTEISYDNEGRFTVEGQFATGGTDPCHVAVSPGGDAVCVANYSSGKVTSFPLNAAGRITGERTVIGHHGHGPHPVRQAGPHAHSILFDGPDTLYAVDLGLDQLKRYRLESGKIVPDESGTIAMAPGSGPRSGAWDRNRNNLYVTNELGSSITRLTREEGGLTRTTARTSVWRRTEGHCSRPIADMTASRSSASARKADWKQPDGSPAAADGRAALHWIRAENGCWPQTSSATMSRCSPSARMARSNRCRRRKFPHRSVCAFSWRNES